MSLTYSRQHIIRPQRGGDMVALGELTVYRGCTAVVDGKCPSERGQSAIGAIALALADAIGEDPTDIPPLYQYIDPDALNAMFDRDSRLTSDNAVLGFQVENWNVFIRSDGHIRVCDGNRRTEPEPVF